VRGFVDLLRKLFDQIERLSFFLWARLKDANAGCAATIPIGEKRDGSILRQLDNMQTYLQAHTWAYL
jgi:hypothetical protein